MWQHFPSALPRNSTPCGHHDAEPAGGGQHPAHVLDEREVALRPGRNAEPEPAGAVVRGHAVPVRVHSTRGWTHAFAGDVRHARIVSSGRRRPTSGRTCDSVILPVQVELAADEVHDRRGNELARGQQSTRVAEDAQNCSATPCGRPAWTRSTSTTTWPRASATTGRGSTAACGHSGRVTCSSSGSSTASAGTSPTWSTRCRTCRLAGVGLRVLAGQGAQVDTTTGEQGQKVLVS